MIGNPRNCEPCSGGTCVSYTPFQCLFWNGATLPNSGIISGDMGDEALRKIDKLLGFPVNAQDTCGGYLGDKFVNGTGITKTIVMVGNCPKIQFNATGGGSGKETFSLFTELTSDGQATIQDNSLIGAELLDIVIGIDILLLSTVSVSNPSAITSFDNVTGTITFTATRQLSNYALQPVRVLYKI